MPRQARKPSATGYYHVMMRGNNQENIFITNADKDFFIKLIHAQTELGHLEIVAWCIMNNHVHLIIKADLRKMCEALSSVNIKYAMAYNYYRKRVGHVFQGRYKSENIENDSYLLQVVRYVHNNPLKADISTPQNYRWCSYNEYLKTSKIISDSQKAFYLSHFNNSIVQFEQFHKQPDETEYLEIKEDIEKFRYKKANQIITSFCQNHNIYHHKQLTENKYLLRKLLKELVHCKLSQRKIAALINVNYNRVNSILSNLND